MAIATETESTRPDPDAGEAELPQILAIVVTHDGRRWLTDSLVGLNRQSYPRMDVLVVDDASPAAEGAPSLKRVAKRHLRDRRWAFLTTPRPLGFGGAINWALSRVQVHADLLLFLHDDAELSRDSIELMVSRLLSDESIAIVGPKVVSWDRPTQLEEVGMAADRFGYPYKGLEDDEIDLGQHDVSQEVFYVTSTCMLVRHDVFRRLRGWDARMRAFAEDLDLCWRARLEGHSIRVEPLAKVRHAIAMATGQRSSRFLPARYFIRRNRFRAVVKNVAGARLLLLIPQILLLTFVEMVGFIVLRQPREIMNLLRALAWNLVNGVQTFSERARVQRARRLPDRKLRRFTVRESTRLRSYVGHQTERLEEAWGRRAETFARRRDFVQGLGARTVGIASLVAFLGVLGLVLGFRDFLWAPQAAIGELLPYPERATALWRAWLLPWQPAGLGQPAPAPPAFALLGIMPLITLGSAGAAQKLLVLGLGLVGFIGAYRLIGEVVDRRSRVVSGVAYALGAVGYAGMRSGDLGAMVFGAAAPFVLHSFLSLTGWVRPPGWDRGRAIARVGLGSAVSAAFVPGSLILYAAAAVLLSVFRREIGVARKSLDGLGACLAGIGVGAVLMLPWATTWFTEGGAIHLLLGDETWRTFASNYRGHGMASVVLGQTPEAPALFGLALPVLGAVAVMTGEGQRRQLALALWSMVALVGLLVAATGSGLVRPLVSTPVDAGVLASVAFAGLAGLAVGAFRMDLPRRRLGWSHATALGGLALACFLAAAGVVPALWRGEWAPGRGGASETAAIADEVRSIFAADAREAGQFRALWVGQGWSPQQTTFARPETEHFLTGSRGHVLSDLFERSSGVGKAALDRVVVSVEEGSTDRGGRLLGAFNIRYVVLERGPGAHRWLAQRDFALVRDRPSYLLLKNVHDLRRVAIYNEVPLYVHALEEDDPTLSAEPSEIQRSTVTKRAGSSYGVSRATGPGVVFLTETQHDRWVASVGEQELAPTAGGWGNAFLIPAGTEGTLSVRFPHSAESILWLIGITLGWIVVVGASFSRRRAAEGGSFR